jgi:chemotaxis protein methyltransferase CheR
VIREEVEQFCALVVSRLGFCVDDHNIVPIDQVLRHRIRNAGCASAAAYFKRIQAPDFLEEEVREVAAEISVPESHFFRNPEHFRVLAELALPELVRMRMDARRLRILSAGCAAGEEPYSLAATIRASLPAADRWDIQIWGIDANRRLLEKAAQACYSGWALRNMPLEERKAYFRTQGRNHILREDLRPMVRFEERNLLTEDAAFWRPEFFDIIFCRNVMIYLTPGATQQVVRRLTHALAPGGFLFLSPSETLRGMTHDFHLRHTHDTFYYQRLFPGEVATRLSSSPHGIPSPRASRPPGERLPERDAESWLGAITESTGRIAALAERSKRQVMRKAPSAADVVQPPDSEGPRESPLDGVMELVRQEQFEEALGKLRAMPARAELDPDALLLKAVLLTSRADVAQAQVVCRQLLAIDELNAGAHYLMAVCEEHAGDRLCGGEARSERDVSGSYICHAAPAHGPSGQTNGRCIHCQERAWRGHGAAGTRRRRAHPALWRRLQS